MSTLSVWCEGPCRGRFEVSTLDTQTRLCAACSAGTSPVVMTPAMRAKIIDIDGSVSFLSARLTWDDVKDDALWLELLQAAANDFDHPRFEAELESAFMQGFEIDRITIRQGVLKPAPDLDDPRLMEIA